MFAVARWLTWFGLSAAALAQAIPFDSPRWELDPKSGAVVNHLGRQALRLKGGIATIRDAQITDGVIELDVAFSGDRGFMGVIWRVLDRRNYEEFYIRPHQSGNPDANQYTPVFNGSPGWQLYHGEGFGAPVAYQNNQWTPVKIIVSGGQAEIYIGNMERPVLFAPELKHETRPGKVGLSAGNFAPGYFSNFRFREGAPALKGQGSPRSAKPNTIMSWTVSSTFDEKSLNGKHHLGNADKAGLTWDRLACEPWGLANLSRLRARTRGADTVYARTTIVSDRDRVARLSFGYSDRVRVYLNDRLIYGGDNAYRSRDYRYLGTIGFFDELFLPLAKGENHLWMAVSESFGGWGLLARFEDLEGIKISP